MLRPPHPQTVIFGATYTTGEVATILRKEKGWVGLIAKRMARQYLDLPWLLRHGTSPRLTLGNALIGRLLLSLRDRKVPILTETRLESLVRGEDRIEGIVATHRRQDAAAARTARGDPCRRRLRGEPGNARGITSSARPISNAASRRPTSTPARPSPPAWRWAPQRG